MHYSQKKAGMMRLIILSLLAILLVSGNVFAQNINIRGKVVDKSGEPLIGVTVVIQGTRTGVATELDGTYSISAPANAALLFTAIGMEDLVEQVNNRSVINVTMNESSIFLEDVVVTALGIKKERKALGYAVSDIKSEELMKNKTANPISSLSGKIAGVNITQSSGAAGSGAQIILRGGTSGSEGKDNQPLFVVDGVILVGRFGPARMVDYNKSTTTERDILEKLFAYEDTGLTPEEI